MPQQTWTIGSDPSCDIVVDNATVSTQHCKLISNGTTVQVVDLGSTNGTFVNGQPISGQVTVDASDRITLGQTEVMPWPSILTQDGSSATPSTAPDTSSHDRIISIGRAVGNTVTLDETNVSSNHARLIISGQTITLEDLGSTNGTSVGEVENKVHRASVTADETIFLGSTAYRVADLINLANKLAPDRTPIAVSVQVSEDPSTNRFTGRQAGLVFVGLLTVCVIIGGWIAIRNRSTSAPESPVAKVEDQGHATSDLSEPNHVEPREITPAQVDTLDSPNDLAAATVPEISLTSSEKLAECLFVIVCSDPQRKMPFRVGTGFAIDANHVATSAAVIDAMRTLNKDGFPTSFLYSPALKSEWGVQSMQIHPRYESANSAARKAQDEHDAIFDKLESKPPQLQAFEAVKEELLASRMKAIEAIELKTAFDVGVITVSAPLERWVSGVDRPQSLRPNLKLSVTGYAFDLQDPFFDPTISIDLSTMQGRVAKILKTSDEATPRLLASASDEQTEYAYQGCPAVNAQGNVVAIYSRSTPLADDDPSSQSAMFDAALIERVRECIGQN